MKAHKISSQQEQYIVENYGKMPTAQIARDAGVALSTICRYLKKNGIKAKPRSPKRNPDIDRQVIALYADLKNKEIAKIVGCSVYQVGRVQKAHGLRKSEEFRKMQLDEAIKKSNTPDVVKRITAKWNKAYAKAQFEMMSGMKRSNKIKVSLYPKKVARAVYYLRYKYNYFVLEGEPYTLYYDSQTKRASREELYVSRYGLRFEQAEEQQES